MLVSRKRRFACYPCSMESAWVLLVFIAPFVAAGWAWWKLAGMVARHVFADGYDPDRP